MYLTQKFAAFIAGTNYDDLPEQVVMLAKERAYEAVRRETLEDLIALDL